MSNQTPNFLNQKHVNETASFVFDASDEEANEDLSLKIVEKALSLQNIAQNGVVDAAAVVKKRKKKKKLHSENQSVFVGKEEENAEIVEKANTNGKEKAAEETPVSGEPEIVELADNMVLRKLLRGPRYFDPPDSGWSTCYNCGEEGHMAVNCKLLEKKRKPCFVCGSLDHGARQCSKGQDCFICKKSGHRAKDCPEKGQTAEKNSRICLKCGDSGHEMFTCRNNYSTDDLKEIQCYVCKRFGHLCCADSVDDSPLEVSCYKCGDLGHTGLEHTELQKRQRLLKQQEDQLVLPQAQPSTSQLKVKDGMQNLVASLLLQQNDLQYVRSVEELGNLSIAINSFVKQFDELQKHLDFIKDAIDTHSSHLALIPDQKEK